MVENLNVVTLYRPITNQHGHSEFTLTAKPRNL